MLGTAIAVARKKLSMSGNAVAYNASGLTPPGPIDAKLFRVVAAELHEQREQFRSLALRRAAAGLPSLHVSYERLTGAHADDELRRVVAFVAGDALARQLDVAALRRSARVPLKNTELQLANSVSNVLALARIAREEFPFLAPSLDAALVAQLDAQRDSERTALAAHKREREAAYADANAAVAERIFDVRLGEWRRFGEALIDSRRRRCARTSTAKRCDVRDSIVCCAISSLYAGRDTRGRGKKTIRI